MDNEPNWDQVRYFVAVARAGSAVGAARRLGVSHATVMRNVAQLEQRLGLRLFDHVRSGYRLTSDGEEVLSCARTMEEGADALMRKAMGKRPGASGELRLVIGDSTLFDPMPLLARFQHAHPRIELSVEAGGVGAAERLLRMQSDAAVLVTSAPPDELVGRQIARVGLRFYAVAPRTRRAHATPKPEDYAFVTWSGGVRELGDAWQRSELRRLTPRPRIVLQAEQHRDALAAVHAGMGVGLLCDIEHPGLVALPFAAPRDRVAVWLLTHPDLRRSGRVRALFDFVASEHRG